jgi:DNA-binding NtrC family response regulator
MGLASAYGTIRNHKGAISVCSEVGRGSTFRVYLPLARNAVVKAEDNRSSPLITGAARILLVDDEEALRKATACMLTDLGHKVTACSDGERAIAYYKESWRETDLVLLDMVMPKLGGRDTFGAMKKINPDVHAILLSGYSIEGEAQTILDEGVMGFIGKPFGLHELSEKVAQVLQVSQPGGRDM